jgi:hypothetical protein
MTATTAFTSLVLGPLGLIMTDCWAKHKGGLPQCVEPPHFHPTLYVPIVSILVLAVPVIAYFVWIMRGGTSLPHFPSFHVGPKCFK